MEEDGAVELDETMEEEQFNYMDAELIRHAVPCPSDNEVRLDIFNKIGSVPSNIVTTAISP